MLRYAIVAATVVAALGCGDDDGVGADAAMSLDANIGGDANIGIDANPNTDAATIANCSFDDSVQWSALGEVLQLQTSDGATCAYIKRQNDCVDICLAHPFTFQRLRVGHAGVVTEVTDLGQLTWTETHHNWSDTAEALTDTVRYFFEYEFSGQTYDLTAFDRSSGSKLWTATLRPYSP